MFALPGYDYVLIARAEKTATRNFQDMIADFQQALKRLHAPKNKTSKNALSKNGLSKHRQVRADSPSISPKSE